MDAFETFRFLLALALTPLVIGVGRKISMKRAFVPFLIGYTAILVTFAASVLRGVDLPRQPFHILSHVAFVAAGLGMAWAAVVARQYVLDSNGGDR